MTKKAIIAKINGEGPYVRVKIDKIGHVSCYLATEDYDYNLQTDKGGRRYLGHMDDPYFQAIHNLLFKEV